MNLPLTRSTYPYPQVIRLIDYGNPYTSSTSTDSTSPNRAAQI